MKVKSKSYINYRQNICLVISYLILLYEQIRKNFIIIIYKFRKTVLKGIITRKFYVFSANIENYHLISLVKTKAIDVKLIWYFLKPSNTYFKGNTLNIE